MIDFKMFLYAHHSKALAEMNDEEIEVIEKMFNEYLNQKFKDSPEKLARINDISMMTVLNDFDNPLKMKGYHPAYVLHFSEFINQEYKKRNVSE